MHDGYLFTLGICGTASGASPAPQLLDALLSVLPPVKRAALLGEVRLLATTGQPEDPLLAPILADCRDAELLLLVTPPVGTQLPPRLANVLNQAIAGGSSWQGKTALLVVVGAAEPALLALDETCRRLGATVVTAQLIAEAEAGDPQVIEQLQAATRAAYATARQTIPHALPHLDLQ